MLYSLILICIFLYLIFAPEEIVRGRRLVACLALQIAIAIFLIIYFLK